jgi:hypothetical protein
MLFGHLSSSTGSLGRLLCPLSGRLRVLHQALGGAVAACRLGRHLGSLVR